MPGNSGVYAVKRRKKPAQKSVKPPPVKTNPSKRHRDRLNGELDRLTGMLPFSEEVRGRLDKLSVLRLSVGYLKVKSYFNAALQKHVRSAPLVSANGRNGQSVSLDGVSFSEGELLLQALNGFVLVVMTDGTIFYTSPTIQDFLGFHQSDVVQQNVLDLVHMEDREMFRCQLHFALKPSDSEMRAGDVQSSIKASSSSVSSRLQYVPPENSSFLDRSFCCRLRCLLDNSSGFLALNFNGRLKYLHQQGNTSPPQLALFTIATPLQPPSVMEIRTKTLIFQSKHRMDFAPMGIDTRGKLVLGYSEMELVTTGSGYQFIHAADMMYCADNHLRMMKTGDSGFTFFRLLTKAGRWLWVQASARVVFKGGRPDFIIARQKALSNEEGEEHLHQRRQQLPFNLATGEGVLYDVSLESSLGPPGSVAPVTTETPTEKPLNPASLLGSLNRQDHSVYTQPQEPGPQLPIFTQIEDLDLEQPQPAVEQAFLDSHALLSVPGQIRHPVTGDLTSEAMIESLEQILGDIGDGGIEGLDVEETELRDWEDTLARLNDEREDVSRELNHILANDVFSYVEEALRRETTHGSDHVSGSFTSLSIQGQHPGSVFSNNQWQQTMDSTSIFAERAQFGDVLGAVAYSAALAQCRNAPQTQSSSLWPPGSGSSSHHCGNQTISTPSCHAVQNTNSIHSSSRQSGSNQTGQYTLTGSQQTLSGPQLQSPSVWQQFHHQTLTHSSHTAGSGNLTPRFSGSCMYENTPNSASAPSRQNGSLLGPSYSRGTSNGHFDGPYQGMDAGGVHQGMMQSEAVGCTDVGNISLGDSGSLQSSFFCWNGEAQIPLNGAVDPFAFPGFPSGSMNLSQNTGP
ncbi:aryl hydrocarbon receptor-like [Anoplopoma fimbria]|uniref:aryl hydrocarbon receptor-like n=1 Tax=Anoplopoma fimbria TaxID=229290 RepID=UPI0023ECCE0C|nr:aryl hydrocarbon receptor-like [Anoplopoma fimbria]